jgi:hypothetical protein
MWHHHHLQQVREEVVAAVRVASVNHPMLWKEADHHLHRQQHQWHLLTLKRIVEITLQMSPMEVSAEEAVGEEAGRVEAEAREKVREHLQAMSLHHHRVEVEVKVDRLQLTQHHHQQERMVKNKENQERLKKRRKEEESNI